MVRRPEYPDFKHFNLFVQILGFKPCTVNQISCSSLKQLSLHGPPCICFTWHITWPRVAGRLWSVAHIGKVRWSASGRPERSWFKSLKSLKSASVKSKWPTLHRVVLTVHVSQGIWDKFEKSWSKDAISLWLFRYFHVHYVHLSVTLKHDRRGVELPPTVMQKQVTQKRLLHRIHSFLFCRSRGPVCSAGLLRAEGVRHEKRVGHVRSSSPSSAKLGHSSRSFWIWAWRLKEGLILRVFLCSYYSSWNFEVPLCVFLCLWWLQSHCKHQRGTTRGSGNLTVVVPRSNVTALADEEDFNRDLTWSNGQTLLKLNPNWIHKVYRKASYIVLHCLTPPGQKSSWLANKVVCVCVSVYG